VKNVQHIFVDYNSLNPLENSGFFSVQKFDISYIVLCDVYHNVSIVTGIKLLIDKGRETLMETKISNSKQNVDLSMKTKLDDEKNLKGTFISVMLLGGFIVLSWVGIYFLYMSRL
jgi:hypothetical protein